jgi:hypothetical protein
MKLSTPVNIPENPFKIKHEDSISLMGSCFAESIGEKLKHHKFNVFNNPFGIIYNPFSLAKSVSRVIANNIYSEDDISYFNNKWLSLDHHGSFSKLDKNECLTTINDSIQTAHEKLKESKTLFITFGSAWVYEYGEFGIVANCHKMPSQEFNKRLLSVKEIISCYENLIEELKSFNPELKIVFTVSPVRHVKDGVHENNLSKSTLHLAVHQLVLQHKNCSYFPAYEIIVDELRDYRYYKDDLVHPTSMAINYVWEHFSTCYFNKETQQLNTEIGKIQSALSHKPFNTASEEYKNFVSQTTEKIAILTSSHPYINFNS